MFEKMNKKCFNQVSCCDCQSTGTFFLCPFMRKDDERQQCRKLLIISPDKKTHEKAKLYCRHKRNCIDLMIFQVSNVFVYFEKRMFSYINSYKVRKDVKMLSLIYRASVFKTTVNTDSDILLRVQAFKA